MAINFPSSPTNGQVYTDTTSAMTWVYSTTDTAWSGSFNRSNYVSQTFTATAGQTSFTVTGGYLPTLIEVYQNGVLLVNGTDVTVTSGTAVVLAVGAVVGDIIQVIGNSTFNAAAIDASAITAGTLAVARGGTGASTLAANNVVLGNGTSAVQTVAPGTNGNVLTSNGTTWTSTAPTLAVINAQTFNTTPSAPGWTKPAGYSANSRVLIQAWGGGGSGSRNSTAGSCGGGGGGGYNERWMTLSDMGATETITIGAGGASRTGSNQAGAQGGDTSVGSLITAYGGAGGTVSSGGGGGGGQLSAGSTTAPGRPLIQTDESGGAFKQGGGSGTVTTANINDALFHGGGGGYGTAAAGSGSSSVWGGGGGGGGNATAAAGTSSFGGNGGAGGATGTAGTQPGGGGGGGTATSGAGAAGRVIITVFPA